ncbi:MAG: ABC transporter substrate-binding protein [Phycisphaerales bacterium]|nr:ABC transporter substrate-binding protein [Phycisphaerales bacterium]
MADRPVLTLAHSADADDVFMWWPITGKVDPSDPSRVLAPPVIDTGRFEFRSLPEDIQNLNRRAIEKADLDITAMSFACFAQAHAKYVLTACGSSFGDGFGPKLVCRADDDRWTTASVRAAAQSSDGPVICVPGLQTSAYMTLSIMLGARPSRPMARAFDTIASSVVSGEADLGVLIHEAQITFAEQGLRLVQDLGVWWQAETGLPLPLGANAILRDLDARFGAGSVREVTTTLRRSIDYALAHRAESLECARGFSPLKSDAELEEYVSMYVNGLTVDAGQRGREAIQRLLEGGAMLGMIPAVPVVELSTPANG